MAFDALLKRYFSAVIVALVALVAYFQASGTTQLIGAALASKDVMGAFAAPPPSGADGASSIPHTEKISSAEPILSRNPFDSVTGPLNATPVELPVASNQVDTSDPLAAPACDGIQVAIITESNDPVWSLAALKGASDPAPRLRRVGDEVNGKQVAFIGFNPRESSPSVWLTGGGSLCQVMLFKSQAAPVAQAPAAPPPPPTPEPAAPAARGPSPVPADIASKIQRVSENEFNVDRTVVDKILENQAELMRSARIVPEQKDGKVVGVRLFGIRPDTLLGTLGMENGDRLESINGFDMASPEKALEAYARLRTASNLNVKVNRRGKPVSIDYNIK